MEDFNGRVATTTNDGSWIVDFGDGAHIRIEGDFTSVGAAGERNLVSQNDSPEVAAVLSGRVDLVTWTAAGVLTVVYTSGATLEVPADPDYEAWMITDAAGELAVATPGGGVTTFPPRS
jgi:hypothetical protein